MTTKKRKVKTFRLLLVTVVFIVLAAVPSVVMDLWDEIPLFRQKLYEVQEDWITYRYDSDGNWYSTAVNGIVYLSQSDQRWGNETINGYTIADSGCTPSVGAMLLNRLLDIDITPYELGLQFHEWGYMNNTVAGSNPKVWKKVADEYNLKYLRKLSYEELETALKDGWLVIMSVQGLPFTRTVTNGEWISHTILLHGLDRYGNTNVMDPYSQYNTRAFQLSELYEMRVELFDETGRGATHAFTCTAD